MRFESRFKSRFKKRDDSARIRFGERAPVFLKIAPELNLSGAFLKFQLQTRAGLIEFIERRLVPYPLFGKPVNLTLLEYVADARAAQKKTERHDLGDRPCPYRVVTTIHVR